MELAIKDDKIYAPLLGKWITATPEETLKQQFILRLVNHYGYDIGQLGQDVVIKNRYKADIGIWKNKNEKKKNNIPSIIIAAQCKAEHITINEEDYLIGYNFASSIKADFFIATNLKETKIFYIKEEPLDRKLERLQDIPKAQLITEDALIKKFISESKTFTRDQFTALLSKCHNIIRNNDKLSPEAAFDEISKILFMKIMYERKSDKDLIFSKDKFKADEKAYEENIRPSLRASGSPLFDKEYMQYLFDKTKEEFKNDELFEELDRIRIRQRSFEMIVEELESFNLSNTSDDIKGIAFEEFLGRTFRGELGQFFTPRTVVDYMVDVLDPNEDELICDPCCGSGGFLIKTFEYVRDKIESDIQSKIKNIQSTHYDSNFEKLPKLQKSKIKKNVNDLKIKLFEEFDLNNKKGRLHNLSYNCIFGTDANPRMARTAKMNMIMHGDGHGGVHHHDGLLNINGIFDGRFDVILTNPPFGSRVNKTLKVTHSDVPSEEKTRYYEERYGSQYRNNVVKQIKDWADHDNGLGKSRGKALLDIFDVGAWSGLTEVLFMERCLNLLKPGGRMGIVLPEGVLNNSALQKIREYIEGRAKLINITSIPQDVFIASGATVKPSLLFLKKFSNDELVTYQKITEDTIKEVNYKYQSKLDELKADFKKEEKTLKESKSFKELKELKKKFTDNAKQIEDVIAVDIKSLVKERFDYPIPVIEVEKAGISSTGAPCENELEDVAVEFRTYRKKAILWDEPKKEVQYLVDNEGNISRLQSIDGKIVGKPEIFYDAYAH
ncbi:N-6 DNA methylase [Dyadobacter luteus]|uniref:N-6 DNA methylase n=1 Tax=Dyadobacter luteus TaxID=2259619 RepID=A0A3D8YFJ2_9BACT|nr:N-6 DNA methylase [Dyadobacter luteus]REA63445.1 N-6 DNA methylase [Dyadobacter luteus]